MIGPRATELVAEATLALRLECTVEELRRSMRIRQCRKRSIRRRMLRTGAAIHMTCNVYAAAVHVAGIRSRNDECRDAPDGGVDR